MLQRGLIAAVVLSMAACSSSGPGSPEAEAGLPDAGLSDAAQEAGRQPDAAQDAGGQPDGPMDAARAEAGDSSVAPDAVPVVDGVQLDSKPALPQLPVVILAGQSNMVGLGINNELSAADKTPVTNTTIYYNASIHPNPNVLKWLPLAPGFGALADRFGPELSFGRRLHDLWPTHPLAIIKVAEGGTALHDRWAVKTGDLYQLLVAEVKQELAVLKATSQAEIVGLVWMQGESDATQTSHANAYQANFTGFVTALKQDLGLTALPVVAGLIGQRPQWTHATTVRNGTSAASVALAPMAVVETTDLPTFVADPIHHDTTGNLALGRRFADALASMLGTDWHFKRNFGPSQGASGWTYRDRQGTSVKLMTWDPQHNRWAGSEQALLIGPGWMHPGPSRMAELAWTSPVAGSVKVDVTVAAGNNMGGDGTWVEIAAGNQTIWGPTAIPNTVSVTHTATLTVQSGSVLQFRTWAGPAQDSSFDTTIWEIDIAPAGP